MDVLPYATHVWPRLCAVYFVWPVCAVSILPAKRVQ